MLSGILDKVTGFLDRRMVLISLLPSGAFWAAVVILTASEIGWVHATGWWTRLDGPRQLLDSAATVALLVLFASVLSAQEGALLRLYEGYWGEWGPGAWLAALMASWHRRQITHLNLDDDVQFERRYRNYPRRPEDAMPTRLGNVLKGAEQYPADEGRYGIDAVFFWPRLIAVVPEATRVDLADARTTLSLMLNVSALSAVLGVGSLLTIGILEVRLRGALWITAAGAALVSVLAYRSALSAAQVYAELVRSVFDVYRGDLLDRLGYVMPSSLAGERELWCNLGQQLYRRDASRPEVLDAARKRTTAASANPQQAQLPPS